MYTGFYTHDTCTECSLRFSLFFSCTVGLVRILGILSIIFKADSLDAFLMNLLLPWGSLCVAHVLIRFVSLFFHCLSIRDRCRTSINVWGDSIGAGVVEKLTKNEMKEDEYEHRHREVRPPSYNGYNGYDNKSYPADVEEIPIQHIRMWRARRCRQRCVTFGCDQTGSVSISNMEFYGRLSDSHKTGSISNSHTDFNKTIIIRMACKFWRRYIEFALIRILCIAELISIQWHHLNFGYR